MKEIGKIDSPGARGYFLTDGNINLAILNFKNDQAAGVERGRAWSGIHHIGFEVEDVASTAEKLAAAGSRTREDIHQALGVGSAPRRREDAVPRGSTVRRPISRAGGPLVPFLG